MIFCCLGSDDFDLDSTPPTNRSSQSRFTSKARPKWNNNWPFEGEDEKKSTTPGGERKFPSMYQQRTNPENPFTMFEMLTRAVFDKFFNDDLFWNHFDVNDSLNDTTSFGVHFPNLNQQPSARNMSSRLRSSSQQRPPPMPTHPRRVHVNHIPTTSKPANDMNFEWLGENSRQKRASSSSRFDNRDSDEENVEDTYVYRQPKPSSINVQRLRRRAMNNQEKKTESCQFCLFPFTSTESRLQHEAVCRHRTIKPTVFRTKSHSTPNNNSSATNTDKLFTSKCSYCHQEVRLSDRLDHEALCKQFGTKRQTTMNGNSKRFYTPTSSGTLNGDGQPASKSSGNRKKQPSENSTAQ